MSKGTSARAMADVITCVAAHKCIVHVDGHPHACNRAVGSEYLAPVLESVIQDPPMAFIASARFAVCDRVGRMAGTWTGESKYATSRNLWYKN